MILVLSVVTTGVPDISGALDAFHQPWPIRVSACLISGDRLYLPMDDLVSPETWSVNEEMAKRAGVNLKDIFGFGLPLRHTLERLTLLGERCSEALSYDFPVDEVLIKSARMRLGLTPNWVRRRLVRHSALTYIAENPVGLEGVMSLYKAWRYKEGFGDAVFRGSSDVSAHLD